MHVTESAIVVAVLLFWALFIAVMFVTAAFIEWYRSRNKHK